MQSLGLVYVAVYQSALKLLYVDKLLYRVRELFAEQYTPKKYDYVAFETAFKKELDRAEKNADPRSRPGPRLQGNLIHRKVHRASTGSRDCVGYLSSFSLCRLQTRGALGRLVMPFSRSATEHSWSQGGNRSTGLTNGAAYSQQGSSEDSEEDDTDASSKDVSVDNIPGLAKGNGTHQVLFA